MKAHKQIRAGAAFAVLGALSATVLQAQDNSPYSFMFKIRAGLTAGDIQDTHFDNKIMGFGAEVTKKMPKLGGALSAELAWEYVPGRHHDVMVPGGSLNLDPYYSYDNRKEYGQGFSLKFAYIAPLRLLSGFDWFAGVSADSYKVRSEFKYTLKDGGGALHVGGGGTFVEEASEISPGAFVGLKYKISDEIGAEVSLRNFGMSHLDFTPGAYLGSATGRMETGSSRGWALEFGISVKL
ncbi:MAG: hypothetical protein FWG02_05960 [Holophagaceae bacterium]|nr:hypothetical protein [Holophagaceae bacterium]